MKSSSGGTVNPADAHGRLAAAFQGINRGIDLIHQRPETFKQQQPGFDRAVTPLWREIVEILAVHGESCMSAIQKTIG